MSKEYTREELDRMRVVMEGESAWDRMKRKSKEEPLVPAVAAQGFTVVAMVAGSLYYSYKEKAAKKEE
ncbi:hypothetical protein DFQ30_005693 [Apophysomyces sp. BC1015]|nr:hypothetical protein DFQ30_005693 [Apophysomyces sp. BC1015]